ncbi:hypothetical protein [Gilliamella apicola]|uniref:hypothetical protein n=1 Tax=Gilliamella apicola TaxID=1196095 RepID=UPI002FEE253A
MARKYQITAEVKKGWQAWGSISLITKSKMTENELIKTYGVIKNGFNKEKVDVLVRNFQCVRIDNAIFY